MNSDPTMRDNDKASGRTKSIATLRDDAFIEAPTTDGYPLILAPEANFQGYRLEMPLKVMSGESDLWLVSRRSDGQGFVLKIYRYGIQPKPEVQDIRKKLNRAYVADLVDYGETGGRHYEVMEHIEGGSLAQWIEKNKPTDAQVLAVVGQLASAIESLHRENVMHRDIKPSNILMRSIDPLDLVLTDFGISSVTDFSMHLTTASRTVDYAAPETITGSPGKASDWWSLGVTTLEMLLGIHPMAGTTGDIAVNYQLVTRGIEVPENLKAHWQLLLRGLLTRDPRKRWDWKQVKDWLAGKRDILEYYEKPGGKTTSFRPVKSYKLGEKEYPDPSALAIALAGDWDEGVKRLRRGSVANWIQKDVADHNLSNILADITEDKTLNPDIKLSIALLAMNLDLPLTQKGLVITPDWLIQNATELPAFLDSSAPEWLHRLRNESWLAELKSKWTEARAKLEQFDVELDQHIVNKLIFTEPATVIAMGAKERAKYLDSPDVTLSRLLRKKSRLSFHEAILLLACSRSQLVCAEVFINRELEQTDKIITQTEKELSALSHALARGRKVPRCTSRVNGMSTQTRRLTKQIENIRSKLPTMSGNAQTRLTIEKELNELSVRLAKMTADVEALQQVCHSETDEQLPSTKVSSSPVAPSRDLIRPTADAVRYHFRACLPSLYFFLSLSFLTGMILALQSYFPAVDWMSRNTGKVVFLSAVAAFAYWIGASKQETSVIDGYPPNPLFANARMDGIYCCLAWLFLMLFNGMISNLLLLLLCFPLLGAILVWIYKSPWPFLEVFPGGTRVWALRVIFAASLLLLYSQREAILENGVPLMSTVCLCALILAFVFSTAARAKRGLGEIFRQAWLSPDGPILAIIYFCAIPLLAAGLLVWFMGKTSSWPFSRVWAACQIAYTEGLLGWFALTLKSRSD